MSKTPAKKAPRKRKKLILGKDVRASSAGHPHSLRAVTVQEKLEQLGVDPVTILGLIAAGDAVALGWMTPAEYDAPPTWGTDNKGVKVVVRPSGREVALGLLPPGLRAKVCIELATYVWGKKATKLEHANPDGSPLNTTGQVVIVRLPDNGRGG